MSTCTCGKPAVISVHDESTDTTREVCAPCAHEILRDSIGHIGAGFEVSPGRVELFDPEPRFASSFSLDFHDDGR